MIPPGLRAWRFFKLNSFNSKRSIPDIILFFSEMSDYDWKSGVYSTWTESSWEVFEVKMFLIPSSQFQVRQCDRHIQCK